MTPLEPQTDPNDDPYVVAYEGPRCRGRFIVHAPSQADAAFAAELVLADGERVVEVVPVAA